MAPRRCRFSIHVAVVITAILYIYLSTLLVFVDQWFGLRTSNGIINAVIFTAVSFFCVCNYGVAIFTDPGRVPLAYMPDIEDNDIHEIKRKGGDLRYCQKCSLYKPPRAHHCRVLLVGSLTVDAQKDEPQTEGSFTIIYVISLELVLDLSYDNVISGLLLIPLTVALSVLLGWHIYLILQNKTTIEYHEGVRAMWLAEKGGNALGPNILCWVCPTSSHIGSGLRFHTAYVKKSSGSASK
ncbi:hypothetical protein LguiA_032172 [Lonicera macranthoides]